MSAAFSHALIYISNFQAHGRRVNDMALVYSTLRKLVIYIEAIGNMD
jgi:hypothetical protein